MDYYIPVDILGKKKLTRGHSWCGSSGIDCHRCILLFTDEEKVDRCSKILQRTPLVVIERLVAHKFLTKAEALELTLDNLIRDPN